MIGAALTLPLWTIVGWGYIGYALLFNEPIYWYDWSIIGVCTLGSLIYVGSRCYESKNKYRGW